MMILGCIALGFVVCLIALVIADLLSEVRNK